MRSNDSPIRTPLRFAPFEPHAAATIASWIVDPEELRQLSPSTPYPLTAEKVLQWNRHGGQAFVVFETNRGEPSGYVELNPLRNKPGWFWIGHLVVEPSRRGCGIGRALVIEIVSNAFKEKAAMGIALVVAPSNLAAIRCYERVGFRIEAEETHRASITRTQSRLLRMVCHQAPE